MSKSTVIYCKHASDIPKEKHFAIVKEGIVMEEGYDRGDPSTRVPVLNYVAYLDELEWRGEVSHLVTKNEGGWRALIVEQPTISMTVNIDIKV